MEIIRESKGKTKDYAPLVLELYENKNGSAKPVKNALENLAKDAAHLKEKKDQREILLNHKSDPYPDEKIELNLTEGAIKILIENNLKFSILTEEAKNALKYLAPMKGYNKARYGLNLLSNSNGNRLNIGEPPLFFRIESLKEANKLGIKTWVDLDPVIDPDQAFELIKKLHPYVNHWIVGKLNNGESDVDQLKFRDDVTALLYSKGASYYLKKSLRDLWTEGDIPTRQGNRNILILAPHGHPSDDTGTYQLARRMADELDCYAVVNEKYRRPENVKPGKSYPPDYIVDLNLWGKIKKSTGAMTDFIGPIKEFKQQILKKIWFPPHFTYSRDRKPA